MLLWMERRRFGGGGGLGDQLGHITVPVPLLRSIKPPPPASRPAAAADAQQRLRPLPPLARCLMAAMRGDRNKTKQEHLRSSSSGCLRGLSGADQGPIRGRSGAPQGRAQGLRNRRLLVMHNPWEQETVKIQMKNHFTVQFPLFWTFKVLFSSNNGNKTNIIWLFQPVSNNNQRLV